MLLVEEMDFSSIENVILTEGVDKGNYLIKGPHVECNLKNRNNRIYPDPVVRPEIEAYQALIKENRAVGELNHPECLEIDPKNISHKAIKLDWADENVVYGESLILDTPNGLIVKRLMDEKIKLATSTRGAGTLKEGIVQADFKYICNDIVWQPSAPHCFVEGILSEDTEWALEKGVLVERQIDEYRERLENFNGKDLADVVSSIFEDALIRNMRS